MQQQVLLGTLAIGAGVVVGVALFIPFVIISYRTRGRLSARRLLVSFTALVYFCAIWTYTLLPLPAPEAIICSGTNLNPLAFVDDIAGALARPGTTLTDPAVLQLVLNVALFAPLGFFLRVLAGRRILAAVLMGLAVSALIEATQLTGVWGLYPCAYRVFDVDDLLTNTTGAALGSLAALIVPARLVRPRSDADADAPRPVTRVRRLLAILCDGIGHVIVAFVVAVGVRAGLIYGLQDDKLALGPLPGVVGGVTAALIWLVLILVSGQSVGDFAVQLRYSGSPLPRPIAHTLRALGGVTGYALLSLLPDPLSLSANVLAIVSLVLVFTTRDARGLPGVLSGQQLSDAREQHAASTASGERS
ncbi:VanZ family protein [Microbacterium oryzae]|uniref:VanZ family protein n=1 Tax=Microbacterium oryzae TaxID=743009 RepID=UPI0025B11443|nr:VanZ family protein [Microbacterium oryzae]MDN3312028.1 VanZ family protein [Microbacterium oryzae]